MAWDWVAPVASAAVGITGIVATFLTGKQGREAQRRSQDEQFEEHRLSELTNIRRVVYARFLGELRQLSLLSGAQSVIDDVARRVAHEASASLPDDAPQEHVTAIGMSVRKAIQDEHGLYDLRAWADRIAAITALHEEVVLMSSSRVAEAAGSVMECVPWTLHQGAPLEEDKKALRGEMPRRISRLRHAMVAEVRTDERQERAAAKRAAPASK